jgi:acyl-coenzyme A thioesterase PaaI-like protein
VDDPAAGGSGTSVTVPAQERLARAIRSLQDAYSSAAGSDEFLLQTAAAVEAHAAALTDYEVPEAARVAGRRPDLVGFGQVLVPPMRYIEASSEHAVVELRCGPLYLGSGGALHGGVAPLVLDDVLGRLANGNRTADPSAASTVRTAYLHVNYRALAPVSVSLIVTAREARRDGRKQWMTAEITAAGKLLADAEALFVYPRA